MFNEFGPFYSVGLLRKTEVSTENYHTFSVFAFRSDMVLTKPHAIRGPGSAKAIHARTLPRAV